MPLSSPDIAELKAIVDWVTLTSDVRELSIKVGDVELFVSRDRQTQSVSASASPAPSAAAPAPVALPAPAPVAVPLALAAPAAAAPAVESTADLPTSADTLAADEVLITAPMVGTYYASPKPGAPAFVTVGDAVVADTVLCIVEVMKLMNNIEARVEGVVSQILVADNQAVEYGQPLMVIKRNG